MALVEQFIPPSANVSLVLGGLMPMLTIDFNYTASKELLDEINDLANYGYKVSWHGDIRAEEEGWVEITAPKEDQLMPIIDALNKKHSLEINYSVLMWKGQTQRTLEQRIIPANSK